MRLTSTKLNLLTNTSIQFLARIISGGLSFLVTLLIIRRLGPSFYGDFVKVTTLLFFSYTFVDLGLNAVIVRSLHPLNHSKRPQLLADFLGLRLILALLSTLVISLWLFFFAPSTYSSSVKLAYLIGTSSVFLLAFHLSATAIFQLQLAYYKPALATILGSLSFLLLTFYFLFHHPSLILFIFSFSFGYLLTALVSFFFARPHFNFRFSLDRSLKLIQPSLWLSLTFIFSMLANKSDVFVASLFRPSAEIGQYNFAYKILDFVIILPTLFMNVVYPLLLKRRHHQRQLILKSLVLLLVASFIFLVLIYPLAPLILYLKPNLHLSVLVLRTLLFSLPLFYLTSPLMWFFVSRHQEKFLALVYGPASLFNLILNFIFVPNYGVIASAWITLATELFIFLLLFSRFLRQPNPNSPNYA